MGGPRNPPIDFLAKQKILSFVRRKLLIEIQKAC